MALSPDQESVGLILSAVQSPSIEDSSGLWSPDVLKP